MKDSQPEARRSRCMATFARSILCAVLFGALLVPQNAFAQACEVDGTTYNFAFINSQLNAAVTALDTGNCRAADRALQDADGSIIQILTQCTERQCIRSRGDFDRLLGPSETLARLSLRLEGVCGMLRTYDNTIVTVRSWEETDDCSPSNPGINPPIPVIELTRIDLTGKWSIGAHQATFTRDGSRYYYVGTDGSYKHAGYISSTDGRVYRGDMKDLEGFCCGNIGKIEFEIDDANTMIVNSKWWRPGATEPRDWEHVGDVMRRASDH